MDVSTIQFDQAKARELYRQYKTHRHYSEPIDWEIQRAYQLIAQGRVVIRALDSVRAAGLNEDGLPKLAICRADRRECQLIIRQHGAATMTGDARAFWRRSNASPNLWFDWPEGSFPFPADRQHRRYHGSTAMVPLIPVHLRPKRGLENYHVLWEAEWGPVVPVDPYLLRRIGKGDLWLVVAAWDLTEVERAVLASRVSTA